MPRGNAHQDRMAAAVAEIADIDARIMDKQAAARQALQQIETAIETLPAQHRLVMREYYLSQRRRTFADVARALHYSSDRIAQLHREALQRLQSFNGSPVI